MKPDGLAFDNYEIGEFFQELLKKFTHEKDEEGRKMEYLQYYTDKLRLFVQVYPPAGGVYQIKSNQIIYYMKINIFTI